MENMLSTVDKVFKVELMKMPPSLQTTLIGDLISGEAFSGLLTCETLLITSFILNMFFLLPLTCQTILC